MRIAVIGAGMAGLSCARRLEASGLKTRLFDKGKGPAGRMASRRLETPLGEAVFDMGAQYFTVRSPEFAEVVAGWVSEGFAAPWPEGGPDTWVGAPTMSAPLKAMAEGLDIDWKRFVGGVSRRRDGWRLHLDAEEAGPFDGVVIALPAEQATPFLALTDPVFLKRNALSSSEPCWTSMFAFDAPLGGARSVYRKQGVVAWAARNSTKPGRTGPETWVVQAEADWSRAHLEIEAKAAEALLLEALLALTDDPERVPIAANTHRWRFALSRGLGLGALWNPEIGLGVCGDWLLAPRVESAWLSGFDLANQMLRTSVGTPFSGSRQGERVA